MLRKYYQVALRSFLKNKVFSIVNILGLTVGLTCCILIVAYVYDELHYDRYPDQARQIYRIGIRMDQNGGTAEYPDVDVAVGEGMKEAYPQILATTRLAPREDQFIRYGDKYFKEHGVAQCDSNFLQVFSIPLLEGDARTALREPNSIVISNFFAAKYFGSTPAMGKFIRVGRGSFAVTGIYDKIPERSHFHYDALTTLTTGHGGSWSNIGYYTYVVLQKGTDPRALETRFPELIEKHVVPESAHDMGISMAEARKSVRNWHFYLLPLIDIHLHAHSKFELDANGDAQYIYIFSALGIFILLLACVNFTNLSTASSARRSREIGVRKVLGSPRKQLVYQFLAESVLLTLLAALLAIGAVCLLLPWFNQLSGKHFAFSQFIHPITLLAGIGVVLLVGLLAGIYPAFLLSSFRILNVLRGSGSSTPSRRNVLRSTLVVFQFVISTSLIIATFVVYRQLYYMQHKDLGYDKQHVLFIQDSYGLGANQFAFKQWLLKDSRVTAVTLSRDQPVSRVDGNVDGTEVYAKENKENEGAAEIHSFIFHVDYDYIRTLGMQMATGRNLSADFPGDSSATVINESAVRNLGWKSDQAALGKVIVGSGLREFRVIGVVKDFNYASAKQQIAPLMMVLGRNFGDVMVRINTADVAGLLAAIQREWSTLNAQTPFSYYFLDDRFASLYRAEQNTGQIFTMFAVIAIVIASLGLFGLVAFTTEQRTKEIGIRKVLGASAAQVVMLLSREFLGLVSISLAVAIPVTWFAMHRWLDNFAYRTGISWWIFVVSGCSALTIALLTISFRAIRAALANPVESLRSE